MILDWNMLFHFLLYISQFLSKIVGALPKNIPEESLWKILLKNQTYSNHVVFVSDKFHTTVSNGMFSSVHLQPEKIDDVLMAALLKSMVHCNINPLYVLNALSWNKSETIRIVNTVRKFSKHSFLIIASRDPEPDLSHNLFFVTPKIG